MFSTHTNRTRFVLGQRWPGPNSNPNPTSTLTLTSTLSLTLTLGGSAPTRRVASWPRRRSITYATTLERRWGCYTPLVVVLLHTLTPFAPRYTPVHPLKVGFYFAFLHHYTRWLSYIALPSLASLAIQVRSRQ